MSNVTALPPAAGRSPYDHLIVKNNSTTQTLIVSASAGDTIGAADLPQVSIRVAHAITFQSDGINKWWPIGSYKPAAENFEQYMTADTEITLALTLLPGTAVTLGFPLLFYWTSFWRLDVSAIAGNQAWDVDIGVYNVTEGSWVFSFDMAGSGEPATDLYRFVSAPLDIPADAVGATIQLAAIRTTTTGTIWARTGDGNDTGHEFTGPL